MKSSTMASRFICRRDGDRVRVFSQHGIDWTEGVPLIAEALRRLPVSSAMLDGEGVVCDERGVTDFGRLRSAKRDHFLLDCYGEVDWLVVDRLCSRPIVVGSTAKVRATSACVSPAARRCRVSWRWWCVSFGGRPNLTPRPLARVRPSPVRARISSRSNSARPPSTVSISRPCGVGPFADCFPQPLARGPLEVVNLIQTRSPDGRILTETSRRR